MLKKMYRKTSNDQYIDNYDLNIDLFHQKVLCKEVLVAVIEENDFFNDSNMDIKMYFDFLKFYVLQLWFTNLQII